MDKQVPDEILDKIASDLLGSGQIIDNVLEHYGLTINDLTIEDHAFIDNITFLCVQCGWWCEAGDEAENEFGETICCNCGEENDQ